MSGGAAASSPAGKLREFSTDASVERAAAEPGGHSERMLVPSAVAPSIVPSPIALLRAGDVPHAERSLSRGELVRVRRGVYAPGDLWRALPPWEKYLARVHAFALLAPGAIFSHESAAALWGMPVLGDPVTVHVTVPPSSAARETGGVRTHRATDPPQSAATSGLLVVAPGETAVTLARHRHPAYGLAVVDATLRRYPTATLAELNGDNETRDSSRGRRHARWALDRADEKRESVLESVSAAAIEWLGFPLPELQKPFPGLAGGLYRADMWWPDRRLVGEPDGESKYDGRFGDPAELLRARHERDRALRAAGAAAIAHWGWTDVALISPLRQLLTGHGLRPVHREDSGRLASLTHLLTPYARRSPSPH